MRIPFLSGGIQDKAEDPVCHMQVNKKNPARGTWEFSGQPYYFCGPGCNRAFQKDPHGFLSGEKRMNM